MTFHDPFDIESGDDVVSGVLHRPPANEGVPAVLFCCDLPGSLIDREGLTDATIMRLNGAGIAVAEFAPRRAKPGATPSAVEVVNDAAAVLHWMQQREDIDPQRVGVLGCGLGAVVATGLAARTDQINRLCLLSPLTGAEALNRLNRPNGAAALLDPNVMSEGYRDSIAALHTLEDITKFGGPTLVVHGAADRIASPQCVQPFADAIERGGHRVDRECIALADHDCSEPEARDICTDRVTRFFSQMVESPNTAGHRPASPPAAWPPPVLPDPPVPPVPPAPPSSPLPPPAAAAAP